MFGVLREKALLHYVFATFNCAAAGEKKKFVSLLTRACMGDLSCFEGTLENTKKIKCRWQESSQPCQNGLDIISSENLSKAAALVLSLLFATNLSSLSWTHVTSHMNHGRSS